MTFVIVQWDEYSLISCCYFIHNQIITSDHSPLTFKGLIII